MLRIAALALLGGLCLCQAAEPTKFYKFDFTVKELEGGKVMSARNYSLILPVGTSQPNQIRTGNRVPMQTGSGSTYYDMGVNIDCRNVTEDGDSVSAQVNAEFSSAAPDSSASNLPPVIRQYKWGSTVLAPLRKPTVIFSSDDPNSKRQMQIELTAAPIH